MDISNMKNIVVLKNLPSNLVEEAIIVLKANQKIKKPKFVQEKLSAEDKKISQDDEYIVKEAELIVSDYISKYDRNSKEKETELFKKYNKLKKGMYVLAVTCLIQLIFCLLCKNIL